MTVQTILGHLHSLADDKAAQTARGFFKAGGIQEDVFLGIRVPVLRQLARQYESLALAEAEQLLHSEVHEARALALLILAQSFECGTSAVRRAVYQLYLLNTAHVNNWDLVDVSAAPIVGGYLAERSRAPLYRLARSASLWERRIAVVATHHFIRRGDFADTLAVARLLLHDPQDLIHKAVGWMLREVGKRDQAAEEAFLAEHCRTMPRTMLRYAIERFPEELRRQYLCGFQREQVPD
jgi:3-methyladenine DNA glycosylase AlkD